MRNTGISLLVLSVTLLPLGCGSGSPSSPAEKIREAGDATIDAAKAKREEYTREMQKQLDELDVKYKALERRAAEAKDDSKKALDEKVKVAKAKRDVAAKKLAEVKEAGLDRWEKVKDGVGDAFDDLKKIFE